jgi:hypothetical protein
MDVTDVLKQVVDDMVVESAEQMGDDSTFRSVIARGVHLMF